MARIRSFKPEFWCSEDVAALTLAAERSFGGLISQADDEGRLRDNARLLHGLIWPLRDEATPADFEDHLVEMANIGVICRYTGCDGKRYVHLPTWAKHQRINRPSASKYTLCREHDQQALCGVCERPGCAADGDGGSGPRQAELPDLPDDGNDGHTHAEAGVPAARRAPVRIVTPPVDVEALTLPGTPPPAPATEAPAKPKQPKRKPKTTQPDDTSEPAVNAGTLVGEYIDSLTNTPPSTIVKQLGAQLKALLAEGIHVDHVRAGMQAWAASGYAPSVVPSYVNQAMNPRPTPSVPAVGGASVVPFTGPGRNRPSTTDERVATGLALAAKYRALETATAAAGGSAS